MVVISRGTKRRRRFLGVVTIATLAFVASACGLPAAAPPPSGGAAPSVVTTMNEYRGPAQLAVNDALTNLAADWAAHLAATGVLQHRNLGSVEGWTHLGETIVQGSCGISDAAVVTLWMNSPPHQAVMLSPVFTSAGVARVCAADGREWVVADFGG